MASKIKENTAFVKNLGSVIIMVGGLITFLLNKDIIIYKDKMVSISFLVPYHNYIWAALIITFIVFLAYIGWKLYSFYKSSDYDPDPLDAYYMLFTLMPLFLWLGIFKILSEPTPVLPLIFSLIIFVPLALFFTRLSINFIKCILSDWYIRW